MAPVPNPDPNPVPGPPATRAARLEPLVGGLLTGRAGLGNGSTLRRLGVLFSVIAAGGAGYGLVMGAFGGVTPDRWPQMLYSASKVPLLLLATFGLALPSFFVLHSLLGVRQDFNHAVRSLLATQAGLTLVLLSLAPITALVYASGPRYEWALLWNAAVFGLASLSVQLLLRRYYRPLIRRNAIHRVLLRTWLGLYAFIGIQMGWLLRPFIGIPGRPTTFFRADAWGNAYENLWRILSTALGGPA